MPTESSESSASYLELFEKSGALLKGHFKLSSGLHSPEYFQCALVLQYPKVASMIGRDLANKLKSYKPTAVVSPAIGGLIIGQEVARALDVRAIFTERKEGKMVLRRGFSVQKKERIVIVEDVITTGGSTQEVVGVIKKQGAEPVAIGSIVDRSAGPLKFNLPFETLFKMNVETYQENALPEWLAKIPITKPGSRT